MFIKYIPTAIIAIIVSVKAVYPITSPVLIDTNTSAVLLSSSLLLWFPGVESISLNDKLYIYYNENKYSYKVVNIYDVEKTGKVKIKRDANKTYLVLITCRHNTNKQIVIIAELL